MVLAFTLKVIFGVGTSSSDASSVGLKSAKRVRELVQSLKFEVKKSFLLINRFNSQIQKDKVAETGLEVLGNLSWNEQIEQNSLRGKSIFDLKLDAQILTAISDWGDKLC